MQNMLERKIEAHQEQQICSFRVGITQTNIRTNALQFQIIILNKPSALHPQYLLIEKGDVLTLYDHTFGKCHSQRSLQDSYQQETYKHKCKVHLRMKYKLPTMLFLKACHSINFECIFILLGDGLFAVFNEDLDLIGNFQIECFDQANSIKHCIDYAYYEKNKKQSLRKVKTGIFMFLFPESIEIHEVEIVTNHKLSKFKPSYYFNVISVSKNIIAQYIHHPLKIHLFDNVYFGKSQQKVTLICRSSNEALILEMSSQNLATLQSSCYLKKICQISVCITDTQINKKDQRVFFSLSNGIIKAYSYRKSMSTSLIFSFKLMENISILTIFYIQCSNKMLALCDDDTIRQINLTDLTSEMKFKTGRYEKMIFLNENSFVGLGLAKKSLEINESSQEENDFTKHLILNDLNFNIKLIFEHNSQIVNSINSDHYRLLHLNDNSLLILENHKLKNQNQIYQTFFPPNCIHVFTIAKNPYFISSYPNEEEFWILTSKSEIYKYLFHPSQQIKDKSAIVIHEVIELKRFLDQYEIQFKYQIISFIFVRQNVPIVFDSEANQKYYPPNLTPFEQCQPLCLGTKTGQILFIAKNKINRIICRLRYFDHPIAMLHQINPLFDSKSQKTLILYSSKEQNKIIFTEISSNQIPVQNIKIKFENKEWIKCLNEYLFVLVDEGTFNLFYFKKDKRLKKLNLMKEEHEECALKGNVVVSYIQFCQKQHNLSKQKTQKFLVIGYSLGQVVIWNLLEKQNKEGICNISLMPAFILENSDEIPVEYTFLNGVGLYFNLQNQILLLENKYLKINSIKENHFQNQDNRKITSIQEIYRKRKKINKSLIKFQTKILENVSKKLIIPKNQLKNQFYLPSLKLIDQPFKSNEKVRSAGALHGLKQLQQEHELTDHKLIKKQKGTGRKNKKFGDMFHLPNSQLYESLISKKLIK